MQPRPHRLVERLPREPIGLEGHEPAEGRTPPPSGLERVEAAQEADPRSGPDPLEDGSQVFRPEGGGVEVTDQEDVIGAGELPPEVDRPAVAAAGVDPAEVDFHVGTRGEHPPQEPLLHPQRPLEIERPQAAVDHIDKGGHFVVGKHHLAILRLDAERELPLTEAAGRPLEANRLLADLARRAHGGPGNLLEATGVVFGEEHDRHRLPGQAFEPHAGRDFEQILEVDRLGNGQIHDRRIPALAASPLLSEGDAPERRAEFGQAASDRLRRHVAWRIGMLGAVAEHDDAGDLTAGDRPHRFLEGSADGGLTRRFSGRP